MLYRSLDALAHLAARFPGIRDRKTAGQYGAILKALPLAVETLDREARNNGACRSAAKALEAAIATTGAPEALEGYIHTLKAPGADSEWMKKMTQKFHDDAAVRLLALTGKNLGSDFKTWNGWFRANQARLAWSPTARRFVVDPAAARAHRAKLARARKGR